jgi:Ca-activated chloride channel homolog
MYTKYVGIIALCVGLLSLNACAPAAPTAALAAPPMVANAPFSAVAATAAPAATSAAPRGLGQPTAIASSRNGPPALPPNPTRISDERPRQSAPKYNPFVDTKVDHLSTFALDVDTASYTMARKALLDGKFPAADSIRPEEFINYFHQDYALPADAGFGVYADGAPSPFRGGNNYYLRIGVQGYDVPDALRKPLSLTFVIDASGSMGDDNKLEMVKESLRLLVDRLHATDTVGIVAYSTTAWVVLPTTTLSHRMDILNAIYSLSPTYNTNLKDGLELGYRVAQSGFRTESTNRVILCTDGVANAGVTDSNGILEYVRNYTRRGITLTAIGVGMGEYNDTLLEQLADKGDGNYYYVDTIEEAHRVFVERLTSTMQVIAKNAKIQVDFNPDVVMQYRLIGYEDRGIADNNFRNDNVDAGEIGAGHSATAIYVIQFRPAAEGRIATIQLRWEDPDTRQIREINGNLNAWDLSGRFEEASPRFQLSVLAAEFAEYLRRSPYASVGDCGQLSFFANQIQSSLSEDDDVREFNYLVSLAMQLNPYR